MDKTQALTLADDAFSESVTPKKLKDVSELFLFKCSAKIDMQGKPPGTEPVCNNSHFRHAGYLEGLMPFIRPDGNKKVDKSDYCVMVCTVCRACYIWLNEQMYDVTDLIDLAAWEKAERDLHMATGPGGQC